MSVSYRWELVKPDQANSFGAGTSNDRQALEEIFGGAVSTDDLPKLRAMHMATGHKQTLWSEIADTLERLQGDNYDKKIELKVWAEY